MTGLAKAPGVLFLLVQLIIITVGLADYCGPPPHITAARFNSSSEAYYPPGTVLSYTCETGYYKQGSTSVIKCIGSGNIAWEFPHFSCAPVACGDPGIVPNADRQGHLFTYRSKVEYICRDGYVLTSGNAIRYCQANNKWSGVLPSCTMINCSIPERPENGQALYSGLTYGSIVKYECNNRLALLGNEKRICQSSGRWTGTTPRCFDVDCGTPKLDYPSGRVMLMHDTKYKAVVEYKCDNGEVELATCQKHGRWEPSPPECMSIFSDETIIPTMASTHQAHTNEVTDPPRRWRDKLCSFRVVRWMCVMG